MKAFAVAVLAALAVGCSTERKQLTTTDPHNPDAPVAEAQQSTSLKVEQQPSTHEEHAAHESHAQHASAVDAGVAVYTCPMHPEVRETDPNARCPKCGMKLEKVEQPVIYTCPMHPEVESTDPKMRCPKCHMKLEPKKTP